MGNIPRWIWIVLSVAALLIVLTLLKVNFKAGSDGISVDQNLVQ